MAIYQIIYRSTVSRALGPEELGRMVSQARVYNFSAAITGVLFYDGEHFLQLMEGEKNVLQQLYARICADPRHTDIITLFSGSVIKRLFSSWSMGLSYASAEPLERLMGYLSPRHQAVLLPKGYDAREVNTDLLHEFVAEYPPLTASAYHRYANMPR